MKNKKKHKLIATNFAHKIELKEANRVDDDGFSQGLWISFFWLLDQYSWTHPSHFRYYIDNVEEGEHIHFTYDYHNGTL
jgi:hypothetical protein